MTIENFFEEALKKFKGFDPISTEVCLWLAENLRKLEAVTSRNFYSAKEYNRNKRPCLSIPCEGDTFAVIFLTSTPRGYQKSVDLTLCEKRKCEDKDFYFFEKVYLMRNKKGKYEPIFLNILQLKELFTLCGCCKNFDRLKNMCK